MGVERVVRLRSLTRGQEQRLAALRRVAELLDSAFVVPGTNYRIGLDPIIGLIPMVGDLASPLFTIGLLWQAVRSDLRAEHSWRIRAGLLDDVADEEMGG